MSAKVPYTVPYIAKKGASDIRVKNSKAGKEAQSEEVVEEAQQGITGEASENLRQ